MPKLLLPVVGLALVSAAALVVPLMPSADATASLAPPSSIAAGNATAFEQVGMKCATRRVCRQGEGCAWRKVCKRW
jgi:hypothetical protein